MEAEKENGRWTKRHEESLGKGCKWRIMHHVTINQKSKRGDKKKNNFSQENCLPKNQESEEMNLILKKETKSPPSA
jgi:hypothetical protein